MAKSPKKLKIAITFDPALLKRVDAAVEGLRISRSSYIERAVLSVLDDSEEMAEAMGNPLVREALFEAFKQPGVLKGLASAMGEQLKPQEMHAMKNMMDMMEGNKGKSARKAKG